MSKAQSWITRNRMPRIHITTDLESTGEKKVELPFVMGVMAGLSGKPAEPLPSVDERKFVEVDVDNFDKFMKGIKPRVAFQVPNTLSGEGNISLDLTFDRMGGFLPDDVAGNVDALKRVRTARDELSNLLSYMDGKSEAEALLGKLLADPELMKALASSPKPADSQQP